MIRSRVRIRRTSLLLAGVLVLAACGGDDNEAEQQEPPSEESATPAEDLEAPAAAPDTPVDAAEASPDEAAGAPAEGGCALVTVEEVDAVTGGVAMKLGAGSTPTNCAFEPAAEGSMDFAVVTASWEPSALSGEITLGQTMEMMAGTLGGDAEGAMSYSPVDGVGDEAYRLEVMGIPMLYAANGDGMLVVSVFGSPDDGAGAVELAQLALGRV